MLLQTSTNEKFFLNAVCSYFFAKIYKNSICRNFFTDI